MLRDQEKQSIYPLGLPLSSKVPRLLAMLSSSFASYRERARIFVHQHIRAHSTTGFTYDTLKSAQLSTFDHVLLIKAAHHCAKQVNAIKS